MRKFARGTLCLALATLGVSQASAQDAKTAAGIAKPALDRTILHAQVILDHLGFSPGVVDGRPGQSFTAALKGFQESRGLTISGKLDRATLRALYAYRAWRPTQSFVLTQDALTGPFTNPLPKDPAEQAKLPGLGYRNAMEKLGEMFHTRPETLVELNSAETLLRPGVRIVVPGVLPASRDYDAKLPEAWRKTLSDLNIDAGQPAGAKVVVDKSDSVLRVLDGKGKLVAQFQATMGSANDPLPIGTWTIKGASYNPPFHYNPKLFWDADSSDKAATLPPGPNGPVGVIWLDLSKPHYGIHGTPNPETIGRAESHGCIRLTNWDAARLSLMVKPGTPAVFQE